MRSGRAAAIAADHCLTPAERDASMEHISVYADLWHSEVAPDMRRRLVMTELLYLASNDRYDRLLTDLNRTDADTLGAANSGSPLAVTKLLHWDDLNLLKRYATDKFEEWRAK
jgi:digeranylgeranylglycerophospholipid reductase